MIKNIRILYVDDEVINLILFKFKLEKFYTIFTANDGLNGLQILDRECNINFVFSDFQMPLMNGLEFINEAKMMYPDIRFFMLTCHDFSDEIDIALKKGLIEKYFKKPCNLFDIAFYLNENYLNK